MANAIIQYLDDIASALEGMTGGKSAKSATTTTVTAKSGGSSSMSVAAEIEAPGISDALERGLLTTILEQQQEVQVSAVKSMADGIMAELEKALFKEVTVSGTTTKKSIFLLIHEKLSNMQVSTTLAALGDTNITGLQDGELLQYNANDQSGGRTGNWINVTPSSLLKAIMGSQQKGSDIRPIYWTGSAWQVISYILGAACEKGVATSISSSSTDNSLATAKAVYNYVGTLGAAASHGVVTGATGIVDGETNLPTASAVWNYFDTYYKYTKNKTITTSGSDINQSSDNTKLVTAGALWDFMQSQGDNNNYITGFSWNDGTTSGPTATITRTGLSSLSVAAIPAANGTSKSGIVTTTTQTFAGNKTFSNNVSANALASTTYVTAGGKIEGAMLVIPSSAPSSYETGKWYISIDPSAISGTTPS